ncbi:transporter [Skermanella stibiiresistens SB22]|uniref:Transporter n=1 Tax=Skermanella stibiiresistens SB22 TaxID=1385369 RepID=W9HDA3_9PROT|nr:AEC family transporter [Skermanella stibiiresistens]EWY41883.1 transporter [Skermanella stibiiresistens SB22]
MRQLVIVFTALTPIFLLILLGYLLRRRRFVDDAFWVPAEKLTYYVFFPLLLLDNLSRATLGDLMVVPMGLSLVLAVLTTAAILYASRRHLKLDGPAFTSVFQGSVRPNTFVGLAAAAALFGKPGVTLFAIGLATVVPLVNVLCVVVLSRHGTGNGTSFRAVALGILRNPIIIGVASGAALNLTGIGRPPLIGPVFEILGDAALPMGLLAVGAGLDMAAARASGGAVLQSSVLKLLIVPGLTALYGAAFGVHGLTLTVAVLFNSLPVAASAYVLARQMGGDSRLMAGMITAQTVLALPSIPLALLLFG